MAFKRWKKSPSKKPPVKMWTGKEMKLIGWCLNKNIGVGISPDWKHELTHWQIDISINDKIHTDPKRYDDENVLDKMYEYYKYYYDKYNKQ